MKNLMLGHGRITLDGRPIDAVCEIDFILNDIGVYVILLAIEDMSPDNLALFMGGDEQRVTFAYASDSPTGRNFTLKSNDLVPIRPLAVDLRNKSEGWVHLNFSIELGYTAEFDIVWHDD